MTVYYMPIWFSPNTTICLYGFHTHRHRLTVLSKQYASMVFTQHRWLYYLCLYGFTQHRWLYYLNNMPIWFSHNIDDCIIYGSMVFTQHRWLYYLNNMPIWFSHNIYDCIIYASMVFTQHRWLYYLNNMPICFHTT